ncbi:MAG: hypothetical protein HY860_05205 [Chlamydiales bacterium]|nr:hypothetical protein [Chlamydiales bacterium]
MSSPLAIHSTNGANAPGVLPTAVSRQNDSAKYAKITLVVLFTLGLIAASVFTGGAAAAAALAGASLFQVTLFSGLCAATGTSALGSLFFAFAYDMFKNTPHNAEDAGYYMLCTLGTAIYTACKALECAVQVGICELFAKALSKQ